jgi:PAS domain S-box-containing protein
MLGFRKKIILSNFILLVIFLSVLFPLVSLAVDHILQISFAQRTEAFGPSVSKEAMQRHDEFVKFYFEMGILIICAFLLAIASAINTSIVQYIMKPVQKIIDAIRPFKEGREELLPKIVLGEAMQGGEFSKLASTLNSLTERIQKQIENLTRQREETEEILESIGEGIIATDTSARVKFVNRTACKMLGISRDKILKQTLNSLKTPSGELPKKCHELVLHALQTTESIVHTLTMRNKGPLYLDLISAPLAHQNGALLVLQDKTSDYKIVELGKDFIANASHELRTPITIIRGFAETLQDLPELSQEMLHEITEKIVRTCVRLDKLVRSLLTLSDIENLSQDRFKPADLVLIAENCRHHLLAANPSVKIALKTEVESAPIIADADLLELAILNILENGVKYSAESAQIEMDVCLRGDEVELKITDRGIGMSAADLPHIFDRFYTVDKARSRKSGGAGLGLSIVKTIVEKHKGKISVTSELGQGTVFTIILSNLR